MAQATHRQGMSFTDSSATDMGKLRQSLQIIACLIILTLAHLAP